VTIKRWITCLKTDSRKAKLALFDKVEILNFAAGGYNLMNQVGVTEQWVGEFDPDALMLYIHDMEETGKMLKQVSENMVNGRVTEYAYLNELQKQYGITSTTGKRDAIARLKPIELELFFWGLQRIAKYCEEHSIQLVIVYIGVLVDNPELADRNRSILFPYFRDHGFLVFDLKDIFEGHDKSELIVAPWDLHPNEKGHALMVTRFRKDERTPLSLLEQVKSPSRLLH
jgi:hypothetical protein